MAFDHKKVQRRLAEAGTYAGAIDGDFGRKSYAALFSAVARRDLGQMGLDIGTACVAALAKAQIDTGIRLAHFLAQTATETKAYKDMTENLRYGVQRLMAVWPSRFPDEAATEGYVNNPRALANYVYANRLGNGDPASGDGWRFRGRGLIQLTGKDNYRRRAAETGFPLLDNPDLAADPATSVKLACLYWTARGINTPADADDIRKVRRAVNGGEHGLEDARTYLARAKALLL